jgi:hypothetical protein
LAEEGERVVVGPGGNQAGIRNEVVQTAGGDCGGGGGGFLELELVVVMGFIGDEVLGVTRSH